MLLALLLYGYATGTFSSRRIEQAIYDSLAFPTRITIRFVRSASEAPVRTGPLHREGDEPGYMDVMLLEGTG